jgi:hypothetical protein
MRLCLLYAFLVLMVGCAKPALIDVRPISADITRCLQAPERTDGSCHRHLWETAETQRVNLGIRLLSAFAPTLTPEAGATIHGLANWLPGAIATQSVGPGDVLRFQTSVDTSGSVDISFPIAPGSTALEGDALASWAAGMANADAAIWTGPDGLPRIVAGAPLLARLLGAPIGGIQGTGELASWLPHGLSAARAIAAADRALRIGRHALARRTLRNAGMALPEGVAPCSTLGAIVAAQGLIARLEGVDPADDEEVLKTVCLDANVAEGEMNRRDQLGMWGKLEANRFRVRDPRTRPLEWMTAENRYHLRRKMRSVSATAFPLLREQIRALYDEMNAATEAASTTCAKSPQDPDAIPRLLALGRADLISRFAREDVQSGDGKVNHATLAAWLADIAHADNQWSAPRAIEQVFQSVNLDELRHFQRIAPLCAALRKHIETGVQDDGGGGVGKRHADRVMRATAHAGKCMDQDARTELVKAALVSAASAPNGDQEALFFVVATVIGLFDAGATSGVLTLHALSNGISAARTDATDDASRALHATLDVLQVALDVMSGRGDPNATERLGAAAKTLRELAANAPPANSPWILTMAPPLHLASEITSALHASLEGRTTDAHVILARMRGDLPGHSARFMETLGSPEASEAIERLGMGLIAAGTHWLDKTAQSHTLAVQAAAAADQIVGVESPAMAAGLEVARIALWDLLAMSAEPNAQAELFKRAEQTGHRLTARIRTMGDRAKGIWQLADMTEVLHSLLVATLPSENASDGGATTPAWTAPPSPHGEDLATSLKRMAVALATPGVQRGTLPALAEAMANASITSTPELRPMLLLAAALLASHDREDGNAGEFLAETLQHLQGAEKSRLGWVVNGLGAATAKARRGRPQLAGWDQATAPARRAEQCGMSHASHALLPRLAHARSQKGDIQGAEEAITRYVQSVDNGFSGESHLACQARIVRAPWVARVSLNLSLGQFGIPAAMRASQPHSFQLGAGTENMPAPGDLLACVTQQESGRRMDRVLSAWLALGTWQLFAGGESDGHRALTSALSEALLLMHAIPATLGPTDAGQLDAARDEADIALLAWVSLIARVHGHIHVSQELEEIATIFARAHGKNVVDFLLENDAPPFLLTGHRASPGYGRAVREWFSAGFDKKSRKSLAAALKRAQRGDRKAPRWGARLADVIYTLRYVDPGEIPRAAQALRPPRRKGHARAVLSGWQLLLKGSGARSSVPSEKTFAVVSHMVEQGLVAEAAGLVSAYMSDNSAHESMFNPIHMAELAHTLASASSHPFHRAQIARLLLPAALEQREGPKDHQAAADLLSEILTAHTARMKTPTEIELRITHINTLGQMGSHAELAAATDKLVGILSRIPGAESQSIQAIHMGAVAALGEPDELAIAALKADYTSRPPDENSQFIATLHGLVAGQAEPARIQSHALQFLAGIFETKSGASEEGSGDAPSEEPPAEEAPVEEPSAAQ